MRAIEVGLPLVRAANTGFPPSDPVGRIVNSLPLGTEGVMDSSLPRPIGAPIYARVGDVPAAMIVALTLLAIIRRRVRPTIVKI